MDGMCGVWWMKYIAYDVTGGSVNTCVGGIWDVQCVWTVVCGV